MRPSTVRELQATAEERRKDRKRSWVGVGVATLISGLEWSDGGFDGWMPFMVLLAGCWTLAEYQREAEALR